MKATYVLEQPVHDATGGMQSLPMFQAAAATRTVLVSAFVECSKDSLDPAPFPNMPYIWLT